MNIVGLFDIFRVGKIKAENNSLKQQLQELHADEYFQVKARLDSMTQEIVDNYVIYFEPFAVIHMISSTD